MLLREMFGGAGLIALFFGFFFLSPPSLAGDSAYGKVTAVKAEDLLVTFDSGGGSYEVRIAGIESPSDPEMAQQAAAFISQRLLNKNCRLRFEEFTPEGQVIGRLFTDDPDYGITDVGVELVRNGLASVGPSYFEYKYGQMEAAERQAKDAKSGIWK